MSQFPSHNCSNEKSFCRFGWTMQSPVIRTITLIGLLRPLTLPLVQCLGHYHLTIQTCQLRFQHESCFGLFCHGVDVSKLI